MNEVCNDPIIRTCALTACVLKDPYKKSKDSENWYVVIAFSQRKKVILEFPDRARAFEWRDNQKKTVTYFEVTISSQTGDVVDTKFFANRSDALTFSKDHKQKQLQAIDQNTIDKIDQEEGFLAKYAKDSKQDQFHTLMMEAGQTKAPLTSETSEVDQRKLEIRNELDTYGSAMTIKARALLLAVAKFYLRNKEINEEDYAKYKLKTEEEGLASNLLQLEIAKQSIYKAYEAIQIGAANPKMFEALTAMQRLVFDMNKYQHEYLNNLENTLKRLKEDLDAVEMEQREANTEDVTWTDGEVKKVMRGKKELILQLEMFRQGNNQKIPMSANPKLHDNDPRLGPVVQINLDDGLKINEADEGKFNGDGFDSFSDKKDKKKS